MLGATELAKTGLTSGPAGRRSWEQPQTAMEVDPLKPGATEERKMNRTKFLAGLCLTVFLAAVPAFAQSDAKPKEPQKPALTGSAAILEQWNDVGPKLIAIAANLPEDKNDQQTHLDSPTFLGKLLHAS